MQRVLSRQIFTTKIFFVVNWEQRPSSASCQRHELPSYLPITKDSPSSLPFRTFFWVIKNQKKGSPTVSVISARAARGTFLSMACTETQSINQCRVGGWSGSFWPVGGEEGLAVRR